MVTLGQHLLPATCPALSGTTVGVANECSLAEASSEGGR